MDLMHTAGPWRAAPTGKIVTVDKGRPIGRVWNGKVRAEWEGNASLMAAAPTMFEALERIVEHYDMDGYGEDAWKNLALEMADIARAAIAKTKATA